MRGCVEFGHWQNWGIGWGFFMVQEEGVA